MSTRPVDTRVEKPGLRDRLLVGPLKRFAGGPVQSKAGDGSGRGWVGRPELDVVAFHSDEVPRLLAGPQGALASAIATGLGPLVLDVEGRRWTYRPTVDGLVVEDGAVDGPMVAASMDAHSWSELATRMRTVMPLFMAGRIVVTKGSIEDLGRWEVVLLALYFGIPAYDPETSPVVDASGSTVDLQRTFSLEDDDAEMRDWLATTGFLHVTGVLTPEEAVALREETERLSRTAEPSDPTTWWSKRPDGAKVLHRILYVDRLSPTMGGYPNDPRLLRLAALLGSPAQAFLDRQRGLQLLIKPAGPLAGISNLPWHHDCWYEAPPITCPSVTIGIQITGSTSETGRFEVIPGSQGKSVSPKLTSDEMAGWPQFGIDTEPGDVTVHLHDVLHASPAPTGDGGRATLYMTYYPPVLAEHVRVGEEISDMLDRRRSTPS